MSTSSEVQSNFQSENQCIPTEISESILKAASDESDEPDESDASQERTSLLQDATANEGGNGNMPQNITWDDVRLLAKNVVKDHIDKFRKICYDALTRGQTSVVIKCNVEDPYRFRNVLVDNGVAIKALRIHSSTSLEVDLLKL